MLAKTGTCPSCGYEKVHCICNNRNQAGTTNLRNTSGQTRKFQNYQNYSDHDDYAETSRIYRGSDEEKFMAEFYPIDGETMDIYIARTQLAEEKLIEHSMYKHIFGGRKPWPSHTSTRYCPVCTLCQFVNIHRDIWLSLSQIMDVSKFKIHVKPTPDKPFNEVSISHLNQDQHP